MKPETVKTIARALFRDVYETNSFGSPRDHAQAQLSGRTHYVDTDTLRFFYARILEARPIEQGAFYFIVESVARDMRNTERGYRALCFDLDGNVVDGTRAGIDETTATKQAAINRFWRVFNGVDVESYYRELLERKAKRLRNEAREIESAAHSIAETENA